MNEGSTGQSTPMTRDEMMSALFANMVLQQTNLAMMFLGRVPHPETGQHTRDLEMAQMFIDQLEMLEAKTKNNLSKQEDGLLRQSLMAVRMAYVEAVNEKPPGQPETPSTAQSDSSARAASTSADPASGARAASAGAEPASESEADDTRKKFTKKY
jgi:hypothetical protein